MSRIGRIGILVLGLGLAATPGSARAADAPTRTFDAPVDRVWAVTESVLRSLGWEIDQSDRAVGWFLTDSPGGGVQGLRRLWEGVAPQAADRSEGRQGGRPFQRELYTEERDLLDDGAEAGGGDGADGGERGPGRHREGP